MKKRLTLGVLLSILSLGFTGCQSSNNYNAEINDAYNNLLNQEKESEYVKTTYKDGLYIENYRNNLSSIERTDIYDKNGKLESRGIIDNKHRLITSVFKDENNKWIGYKEGISDPVIKENAKVFETSAIDTIC
ncbi:hypothetical protein CHL78_009740 [Romboutsia weinsteinii]|uniref:Uncharacterized protein n=1 Tax=Romboutsia weinsteinii TaxID=2020949 RepID=A0A371J394_9FIRM|nr:hypothetical protein [Romboutsia weinsteinii]RDY27261.1 hypothetical protein CHL78_009740 [Romboutsia weinsteinii]